MSELTMTCQPIENLSLQNCKDFFIRKDGILHNGINVNVPASIRNIADGKIVAMRLTDDYTQVNSIKSYDEIYETFLAGNNLNDKFFQDINLIKDTTTSSNTSNSDDKFYYTKKIDKKKKFYYSINEKLEDYDKIEALYFLNEIISNNFVLLEHELQKINGDKIKFFSLYNHLAPLGRMTVAQKLQLFWYEHKITMKTSKYPCCKVGSNYIPCELEVVVDKDSPSKEGYCNIKWSLNGKNYSGEIAESYLNNLGEIGSESHQKQKNNQFEYKDGIPVFKTHDGNNPSRRTLQEIVDVKTLFEFDDFQEIVKYNNKIPLKVRYDKNKEGYIYLNEKLEYKESDWDDSIKKFYNVIGKEEEIKFLNFQIKVCLKKDFNTKDQVFTPSKTEVNKGTKIGFSGFNFMEKDKLADNVVILKDGEPKPFTVHIETFFPDDSELNFNYNNENKWEPFYLQVNSEYQACTEKPATETTASSDSYEMSLVELIGEEKLYSDELFFKIKVIANIKNNYRYVENGVYTKWVESEGVYHSNGKSPAVLYNQNGVKISEQANFYKEFLYLYGDKKDLDKLALRRFKYFYEPINKEYYVKQSDFNAFKKDTNGEPASKIYINAKEGKHFFIKTKLDNTNLFSNLSKKILKFEKIQGSLDNPSNLEFQDIKIFEYEHLSTYNCKDIWLKTKSPDNKEYWIKQSDIKSEKNGTPIEVVSYNDWSKDFEVLELKDKKNYKIKDFTNDNISKKTKAFKESFNYKKNPISENVINIILNEQFERNFIFEHKNEWDASKQLIESYSNKSKAEKILKEYEFFSSVKSKLKNDIFFYVHPYYFVNRLEKLLSVPDFNPYEDLSYKDIFADNLDGCDLYTKDRKKINKKYSSFLVKTNPGFSPCYDETWSSKHTNMENTPNVNNYGCITGFFNSDYIGSHSNYTYYYHEGVDFRGSRGTKVISLINGTIKCFGKTESMGGFVLMNSNSDKEIFYLAVHLDEKSFDSLYDEKLVKPGDEIAKIAPYKNDADHLHVSVIKQSKNLPILSDDTNSNRYNAVAYKIVKTGIWKFPPWSNEYRTKMKNPFDYNSDEYWAGKN